MRQVTRNLVEPMDDYAFFSMMLLALVQPLLDKDGPIHLKAGEIRDGEAMQARQELPQVDDESTLVLVL